MRFLFRCMARVRAKTDGSLEIVETQHNHDILTERRKKGSLKAMYDQKRKQQQLKEMQKQNHNVSSI